MRSDVVQVDARGESNPAFDVVSFFQAIVTCQSSYTIFNSFRYLRQRLSRLDILLRPLSDLSVDLGTLAIVIEPVNLHTIEMSLFFVCGSIIVFISVIDDLTLWILAVWKEVGEQYSGRVALGLGDTASSLLLLWLSLFLLFCGCIVLVL